MDLCWDLNQCPLIPAKNRCLPLFWCLFWLLPAVSVPASAAPPHTRELCAVHWDLLLPFTPKGTCQTNSWGRLSWWHLRVCFETELVLCSSSCIISVLQVLGRGYKEQCCSAINQWCLHFYVHIHHLTVDCIQFLQVSDCFATLTLSWWYKADRISMTSQTALNVLPLVSEPWLKVVFNRNR